MRGLAWMLVCNAFVRLALNPVAAWWDWDEVLMIAMGFAGVSYIIVDQKRERRLDEIALDHASRIGTLEAQASTLVGALSDITELRERVARLEANNDDSVTLEGRLRAVEVHIEKEEKIEDRLAEVRERVAVLETHRERDAEDVTEGEG